MEATGGLCRKVLYDSKMDASGLWLISDVKHRPLRILFTFFTLSSGASASFSIRPWLLSSGATFVMHALAFWLR